MISYTVTYLSAAEKFFQKAPTSLSNRVLDRVSKVAANPLAPNTNLTKLKDPLDGYRLRVGDYRVIYLLDHPTHRLIVTKIAHRSEVYL